jgi:hypothetical protein
MHRQALTRLAPGMGVLLLLLGVVAKSIYTHPDAVTLTARGCSSVRAGSMRSSRPYRRLGSRAGSKLVTRVERVQESSSLARLCVFLHLLIR